MKFKGTGIIWDRNKNKTLVNFKNTEIYETTDKQEIEILTGCSLVEIVEYDQEKEVAEMTKNEVMEKLDDLFIEYNPRDKKEVLLALLEG